MGKSDDSIRRRKSKLNRKKQNDSLKVSTRVASIIAAKKRRKTGKRSMCQGMCYSLPTPEDPFNDKNVDVDIKKKVTKKVKPSKTDQRMSTNRNSVAPKNGTINLKLDHDHKMVNVMNVNNENMISDLQQHNTIKLTKAKIHLIGKSGAVHLKKGHSFEIKDCPSKFLIMCLNSIQNALRHDGTFSIDENKPLFVDTWGLEFWKCYSIGEDMLETSGDCSTSDQIAWVTSTAADTIARKEKEGLLINSPFLLFLVPSQEKASMVRAVCKPLKALGIHTVSLHPGASLEHQIHGLKSCEPEFLVSTPERLLELVSMKAIDISGVSLLVVDGLETYAKGGHPDIIKSIRQCISGNPQTLVFNGCSSYASIPVVQNLLPRSVCRLALNDSITSQSMCIIQSVHVCDSEEEKLAKGLQVLDQLCTNELNSRPIKLLFIVGDGSNSQELVAAIKSKGYPISTIGTDGETKSSSETGFAVFMMDSKYIGTADFSEFEVVLHFNFAPPIDKYIQILTRMARFSINGMLHSFLTREDALFAGPLVEILEQCRQTVPEPLRHIC